MEIALSARIPDRLRSGSGARALKYAFVRYEVAIEVEPELRIAAENLWLIPGPALESTTRQEPLFPKQNAWQDLQVRHQRTPKGWRSVVSKTETDNDYFRSERTKWNSLFRLGPERSALANLPEDESRFPIAIWFRRLLVEGTRVLALDPRAMKRPAPAGSPATLLLDGSNLAWVIHYLEEEDPDRLAAWVDHLRTALPDLRSVGTHEVPEDRSRYVVAEFGAGQLLPSWVLSDGILRMMGLTLLAYSPTPPGTVLIEEPENGLHPTAISAVVDSLRSVYDAQVLCATHSPVVLATVTVDDVLCFGRASDGSVDIVRGPEHPRLKDWTDEKNLVDLFLLGVLG